jgi:hypothetical protein
MEGVTMGLSRRQFVSGLAGVTAGICMGVSLQDFAQAEDDSEAWSSLHPQYIFLNRTPGMDWNQNRPETITDALFEEPMKAAGVAHSGTRRLGMSFVLSYNDGITDVLEKSLRMITDGALKHDVPVLIVLDGENWWGGTPELWNWWDKEKPGYNPRNAENVEWSDWGPEHAVKICWRNWGSQIRVLPQPNLGSPRFRNFSQTRLTRLAVILKQWADNLPAGRRYLFPGVKIGWEASIGWNAYYYPNGNHYLEEYPNDSSHDPTQGMNMAKDFAGGLAPLGYAALTSLGWKHDGMVTLEDQEKVTQNYLKFLSTCCHNAGLPRNRVFTHAGAQCAPYQLHYSYDVAINSYSYPGWSLYFFPTPSIAGDLVESMKKAHMQDWCAAEWLPAASTAEEWRKAIDNTLGFLKCHFLSIYNWEGIRQKPEAIQGIQLAVAEEAN